MRNKSQMIMAYKIINNYFNNDDIDYLYYNVLQFLKIYIR